MTFLMTEAPPVVEVAADKYLYERVARIETETYVCRIWCGEDMVTPLAALEAKIEVTLYQLEGKQATSEDVAAALYEICSVEGMNSVEITQKNGVGMCVHKNWP